MTKEIIKYPLKRPTHSANKNAEYQAKKLLDEANLISKNNKQKDKK